MANNVTTRIQFYSGNDEAKAYFNAIISRIQSQHEKHKAEREAAPDGEKHKVRTDVNLYELYDDTMELVAQENWSELIGKIGSKWAYVEDWYEDSFTVISAWGIPDDFINRVASEVGDIDPEAIITATYDDEMPNFIGVNMYVEGDLYDSFHLDSDEYSDYELAFWWDEEENDGEEEPDDFEPTWEEAWNLLDDELKSMLDGWAEYKAERDAELAEEAERLKGE